MNPHAPIESVRLRQVHLPPKVVRTGAIQSLLTQETLLPTLRCSDGVEGTGYACTMGTGDSSVVALRHDHLAPRLLGRNPRQSEAIWKELFFFTPMAPLSEPSPVWHWPVSTPLCGTGAPAAKT